MSDAHIVIWVDRDDYEHIQRAYARMHITPSQIVRIATDRFLVESEFRKIHPFAVAQPVERDPEDGEDEPEIPGRAENGTKISIRIDRERRDALRAILQEPYSLGAFVRGALVCPGVILGSRYLDDRFRDLVGDTGGLLRYWHDAPREPVYDLEWIDAQPDMTRRRGAALKRPRAARKLAI